jgi:uncharacterized protein (TIGR02996 family)
MPRYERRGRFWEIELHSVRLTVCFGAIGGPSPEAQTKVYFDVPTATKAKDKAIRAKLRDGYKLVADRAPVAVPAAPYPPGLDEAIFENPDDDDAFGVLADWLSVQGDRRAELVELQRAPATRNTEARIATLVREHRAELLGGFDEAHLSRLDLDWHLGTVRRATFEWRFGPLVRAVEPALCDVDWTAHSREQVAAFLALPATRFLRELVLHPPPGEHTTSFAGPADAIERESPRCLRSLALQVLSSYTGSWPVEKTRVVVPRSAAIRGLRTLSLRGGTIELRDDLDLPELLALGVATAFDGDLLARIGRARLPKLERLGLDFADGVHRVADLGPVLEGTAFPALTSLAIMGHRASDELVRALAKSPLLPRLTRLVLTHGNLSDAGVAAMARAKRRFAHLEELDLTSNAFTRSVAGPLLEDLRVNLGRPDGQRTSRAR